MMMIVELGGSMVHAQLALRGLERLAFPRWINLIDRVSKGCAYR